MQMEECRVELLWSCFQRLHPRLPRPPKLFQDWDERTQYVLDLANKIRKEDIEACSDIGTNGLELIEKIYKKTGGYPRKITQICHELLLSLLNTENRTIDGDTYDQVFLSNLPIENELNTDKKEYDSIAVNKLLDVLRKDSATSDEENLSDESDIEDDWIGGPKEGSPEQIVNTDESETDLITQSSDEVFESDEPYATDINKIQEKKPEADNKSVPVEKEIAEPVIFNTTPTPNEMDMIGHEPKEKSANNNDLEKEGKIFCC